MEKQKKNKLKHRPFFIKILYQEFELRTHIKEFDTYRKHIEI